MRDRKAPALEAASLRGASEGRRSGGRGTGLGRLQGRKEMTRPRRSVLYYHTPNKPLLETRIMTSQVLACLEELRKSRARENDILIFPVMWCFTRNDPELGESGKQSLRSDEKAAKISRYAQREIVQKNPFVMVWVGGLTESRSAETKGGATRGCARNHGKAQAAPRRSCTQQRAISTNSPKHDRKGKK